ncbi:efflux RND transporter periplasmic adaptor subunit [Roseateles saccharophilus]|uniref:RND family efflux transporter MFP subunit n=1 Tax=Roseateles saccharophilus TaxID=304 RepID=A0A4R3URB2_ROSSA|nr:efflux RND transporter periplasmic adaptor subunit [Roseateles saccharophilus]MDG0833521.1 efflux RND transporter periplasmic adaptor subunit [Roseateles saccharophilus]TCU92544.1 RND family efflux transporter MFP subunit [Roseateles saccharophilus]
MNKSPSPATQKIPDAGRQLRLPVLALATMVGLATPMGAANAAARMGDFDCLLEPSLTLEIRSPVTALIERVHAERGGIVRHGTPLVTLVSSVERAAVDLARFKAQMEGPLKSATSRMEFASNKLRRRTDLAQSNYISVQDRDDAASEYAIAQADAVIANEARIVAKLELAYAAAQLGQRFMQSPIDGVVVDQVLHAGELAEVGENKPYILKLAQVNPLRVKLLLSASLYPKVKIGMRGDVFVEQPAQDLRNAVVTQVDKVIDAASGTFQVHMDVPNPTDALIGGLRCRASLKGL